MPLVELVELHIADQIDGRGGAEVVERFVLRDVLHRGPFTRNALQGCL
jgi:hypothetical protein